MYEKFEYDNKNSYFNNFYNWWSLDCEEKRAFGENMHIFELFTHNCLKNRCKYFKTIG